MFREKYPDSLGRFFWRARPVSERLAAVYSGGSGSSNTVAGPLGLVHGIVAHPEPDQEVSDFLGRIPFRRYRYESMPRDRPLVFGHPLI